jgi:hypothetical protein
MTKPLKSKINFCRKLGHQIRTMTAKFPSLLALMPRVSPGEMKNSFMCRQLDYSRRNKTKERSFPQNSLDSRKETGDWSVVVHEVAPALSQLYFTLNYKRDPG